MSKLITLVILFFGVMIVFAQANDSLQTVNVVCDSTIWNHVYDPSRLVVIQYCIELTGIVWDNPTAEGDADYHILVRIDSGYANYLNHNNYELKDSCLVVEVVCAVMDKKHKGKVKTTLLYRMLYADLPGACDDYYNSIYIPKKGEHVRITGPLIIDEGEYDVVAHGWVEIHPAAKIELIP